MFWVLLDGLDNAVRF
nr:translational initiation factor 1 [Tetradium glabrifolium]WEB52027.1 translational initiation factor 1 [Tetradium ruticarpum]WEB52116.1 translational initiation factor 1 [Tetradium ruticarpum]WEB52205.1 translational initiation factor 1 [Tetradium ruticarpum]WEB52294.1 translational initiation factor 1 [Tetradium ruticarpum]WEB52383.1 translational initiation factor 1 [Tetradium ruticarpum]